MNSCLTANHISAASKLLRLQFPRQNGLQDTSYLLQKSVWNSSPRNFIQIIYVDPGHWACLSNIFCRDDETVDLYDSAHTTPCEDGSIVKQVSLILRPLNLDCIQINLVNVSLQAGGTDCGLFSIATATELANGKDPFTITYSQELMRTHLRDCFEKTCLTPFVSKPRSRQVKKRILCTFRFRTNINADQAEEEDSECSADVCRINSTTIQYPVWVSCDICHKWYHLYCIGHKKAPKTYICDKCN